LWICLSGKMQAHLRSLVERETGISFLYGGLKPCSWE
jgi:hypothetical protein